MQINKKTMGIILTSLLLLLCIMISYRCFRAIRPDPLDTWNAYVDAMTANKYKQAYACLSKKGKEAYNEKTFVDKYTTIYNGIQADDFQFEVMEVIDQEQGKSIVYTMQLNTLAGPIQFEQVMPLTLEDNTYRLDWSYQQIFPQMQEGDGISVQKIPASRGRILDRNQQVLSEDGTVWKVGLVPGQMKNKEESIQQLAKALQIDEEAITSALTASWVKDDLFVPVKTIPDQSELKAQVQTIAGVKLQKTTGRRYPYAEICAHLTGYIQNINAEELEKHKQEGYDKNSKIGKNGLEASNERLLHGLDGWRIDVLHEGRKTATIAESKAVDGKDITTTIDITIQQKLYEQLQHDEGAGVVMASDTGEVLALVSTPSYDPNTFVYGMSNQQWVTLHNDPRHPLETRFLQALCPGSTFKAVTGAIGLDTNAITAEDDLQQAVDKRWQKDSSWGDYFVKTTQAYEGKADLQNALIYSDNTFFAKLALRIGADAYAQQLTAIGFQERIDFPLYLKASSFGDKQDLQNDITLADTGYGQGKLQISAIHLNAIYTAFTQGGTIRKPYLLYDSGKAKVWKQQAFSKEAAQTIQDDLIATFTHFGDNPTHAGGKTGTAQVGDKEIGWLCGTRDDLTITLMVDQIQQKGESSYIIPMMQKLMKELKFEK